MESRSYVMLRPGEPSEDILHANWLLEFAVRTYASGGEVRTGREEHWDLIDFRLTRSEPVPFEEPILLGASCAQQAKRALNDGQWVKVLLPV